MKSRERSHKPPRWAIIVVIAIVAVPSFAIIYLALNKPQSPPHQDFLAVRGEVLQQQANATFPLSNTTVIVTTEDGNAVKGFTNCSGHYEIWVPFPTNTSSFIYIWAFKDGYEDTLGQDGWRNQLMPAVVVALEGTTEYTVWGSCMFDQIVLREIEESDET